MLTQWQGRLIFYFFARYFYHNGGVYKVGHNSAKKYMPPYLEKTLKILEKTQIRSDLSANSNA